jgi:hypothetical protein
MNNDLSLLMRLSEKYRVAANAVACKRQERQPVSAKEEEKVADALRDFNLTMVSIVNKAQSRGITLTQVSPRSLGRFMC